MKMTDIMKKSHSESKSENLDAILQKIDNKAFITNSADSAHTETKPQPIKLRRKSVGIAAAAACAAIAVGAFAFSGLLKPDIDATTPAPSTASTDTTTQPPQTPQPITVPLTDYFIRFRRFPRSGAREWRLCPPPRGAHGRGRPPRQTGRRHARKT